ncbi:MAG TPA: translation initiation factor IF-2 subunit beta [Candidatus Thermoplasmatota archaeon]|jgi:translation initiation factor 2 subunit 2|nr:translation initiation factor IF-2 subunit beta [Candidatus Thermoplasmatota archaeon]
MSASPPKEEYLKLLQRARQLGATPQSSTGRFQVPAVEGFVEGNNTVISNFGDILKKVRREPEVVLPWLLRELGRPGDFENGRLTLRGNVPRATLERVLNDFVNTQVLCSECSAPDTHIEKQGRIHVLRCEACGAHRPIEAASRIAPASVKPAVQEGETYEVTIEDVGKRGDGVARFEGFLVFVEGGMKGQTVRVKVDRINGNMAFAHVVVA